MTGIPFQNCPILRDPGGVSRAGRKGATKVFKWRGEPLGTDSHRTISKHRLPIRHEKCLVLLCPIGEQHLLISFCEFIHDGYWLNHGLSSSCTKEMHTVFQSLSWLFQLLTCSNTNKLSWNWIPINHIQVQKEKENFVTACLHPPKTWNLAFSHGSRAVTAKKCTKKPDVHVKSSQALSRYCFFGVLVVVAVVASYTP